MHFNIILLAAGATASVIPLDPISIASKDKPTVYDVIRELPSSAKFLTYLDNNMPLREKLSTLSDKYTIFVPTDEAFAKLPPSLLAHLAKTPDVGSDDFLRYHIVPGDFSGAGLIPLHTVPSLMEEGDIGDHPQRLRIEAGVANTEINFHAKILESKTDAVNGAVHQIDSVLVEPPRQGKLLEHLPGDYSTSRLALEKTNLGKWLHRQDAAGSTGFIPSNSAWQAVDDDVRNWLFSEDGKDYLRVLLEYHVVQERTLYSDALYFGDAARKEKRMIGDEEAWWAEHAAKVFGDVKVCQEGPIPDRDSDGTIDIVGSKCQVHFPTVLEKSELKAEVSRLMGHVTIKLNDHVDVDLADGVARDGVLHGLNDVLLPKRSVKASSGNEKFRLKDLKLNEVKNYLADWVKNDGRLVGGHNHWMDDKTPGNLHIAEKVTETVDQVVQKIHHMLDDLEL